MIVDHVTEHMQYAVIEIELIVCASLSYNSIKIARYECKMLDPLKFLIAYHNLHHTFVFEAPYYL